jgi:hypothetical protein
MIVTARNNVIGGTMGSSMLRALRVSIAGTLILLLAAPLAQAAPIQAPQNQAPPPPQSAQAQPPQATPTTEATAENMPEAPTPQLADPAPRATNLQADQQQNSNPVGTAAAPAAKPTGVAASRPAGAAIAPAKQRRVHTIAIRVAIIVGAGVAIGTVAALSRSNSGRP